MHYISTRGGIAPVGFAQAVLMGLADDGGLLIPESLPSVEASTLRHWSQLTFQELAVEVMTPFVGGDLTTEELSALVQRSYASFSHPAVTPVVQVGEQPILELFHGPTAAFKDVALQFLGNLFEWLLERDGGRLNILGATSGDTGSAAIHGVRGKARINIVILHPQGKVSPIQERQMTTVLDDNVHNIALQGSFDDAQRLVKALFGDLEFKRAHHLGAVNSINWARILAQMVYYFYAWGQVSGDPQQPVSFAVPTGNFGDIFAGYLAKRMGLPVERLILATNRNDILTRFMVNGVYELGDVHATLSPSMDIQVASNFERYLYYLAAENPQTVQEQMAAVREQGRLSVTTAQLRIVNEDFCARAASDNETLEQIKAFYDMHGYILDPHTAVGVHAAANVPGAICLATAHPAKFPEAVRQAIGVEAPPPSPLEGLMTQQTRCIECPAESEAIKQYIRDTLV